MAARYVKWLVAVMGGGQLLVPPVLPYGRAVSARCMRRVPEAVYPGMTSRGVRSGTREVVVLVMYMEDVAHWLVMAPMSGVA